MYIMRVCKYYGLSIKQLDLLFDSLVMSIFTFAIELWGCAYDGKYLNQIDKFIKVLLQRIFRPLFIGLI